MTARLAITDDVFVAVRETPWDARAFGRPTLDITELSLAVEAGADPASDEALFLQFHALCEKSAAGLVTIRVDADRRAAIGRLQGAGFRYVETAYRLSCRNVARYEPPARVTRTVTLREARPDDHTALVAQAADSFRYGRFAEDPWMPADVNRRRQIDWIEGLLAGRARVLVADLDGAPAAFMALRVNAGIADLILAGTRPRAGILAYPLWIAVMKQLREEGVSRAETMISAANLGVVNLYGTLGFRFDQALVGLHLHRP
ncbi:MAG: hypothetical protein Q8O26_19895 [Phreatobacter sp.]|uniref:hypothetical protein n=1 Tax=Phreatobacter sp. TaxID=1966341 RepID=UPI002735A843|nr:hypothetical protein [Phreatobacter sp.]MDP2804141.1 hypothetical protein [Phreatobacter sp.]